MTSEETARPACQRRPRPSGRWGSAILSAAGRPCEDINLDIRRNEILGIIGPAGSGKTTFLRALNRLNDLAPESRVEGRL